MRKTFDVELCCRIIDFFGHFHDSTPVHRSQWRSTDQRLISVGFLSVAYIFAFLSTLSFTRTSRLLGSLQVSLTKMIFNVLQFLAIFLLLMIAFTISFTELFWYTGTSDGKAIFCESINNVINETYCSTSSEDKNNTCTKPIFTGVFSTIADLFWALFGQLDIQCLRQHRRDSNYINDTGVFLMGIYHICIIFILLNMLIAMMTESFDSTNQNKDLEWKFHRTDIWIRYIRQDFSAPPPMNLLPELYNVYIVIRKAIWLRCWAPLQSQFVSRVKSFDDAVQDLNLKQEKDHLEVSRKLMQRYKTKFSVIK